MRLFLLGEDVARARVDHAKRLVLARGGEARAVPVPRNRQRQVPVAVDFRQN